MQKTAKLPYDVKIEAAISDNRPKLMIGFIVIEIVLFIIVKTLWL